MKVSLHRISKLGPSENPDSSLRVGSQLLQLILIELELIN